MLRFQSTFLLPSFISLDFREGKSGHLAHSVFFFFNKGHSVELQNCLLVSVLSETDTTAVIQGYYKRNRHFQRYVVSPDLTPCDFFLWGYIKDRVFRSSTSGKFKRTETTHHNSCCKVLTRICSGLFGQN